MSERGEPGIPASRERGPSGPAPQAPRAGRSVAVVTDSAAAIPSELAARHHIGVVPMWLTVGDDAVREGERPLSELLGDARVTTAAPSPGEFAEAVELRLAQPDVDAVLVLTIAASMSGTHGAAVLGTRDAGPRVQVLDTQTAAGAEALVVLAAARAAEAGGSLDEVAATARRVIESVRLAATVPNLDHLVRSGRVPGIAGWAGRRLGINPLFEFRGGKVHRLRPALGHDAALDRILGLWRRSHVDGARLHVAALHALAPSDADDLLARVQAEAGDEIADAFVGEFGSVMVVHTGPGLVGLAWWWEPPD